MIDNAVKSPFNNGNGLGSGTFVASRKKKKKRSDNSTDIGSLNINFFGIFDELANVVSSELRAMERAKRANITFNSRF